MYKQWSLDCILDKSDSKELTDPQCYWPPGQPAIVHFRAGLTWSSNKLQYLEWTGKVERTLRELHSSTDGLPTLLSLRQRSNTYAFLYKRTLTGI